MSARAILDNEDALREILSYVPGNALALTATCKAMQEAFRAVGMIFLSQRQSKRYLVDANFRAVVHARVLNPAKQVELLYWSVDYKWTGGWQPEYAEPLASVKDVQMIVCGPDAKRIPWNLFTNISRVMYYPGEARSFRVELLGALKSLEELHLSGEAVDLQGVEKLENLKYLAVDEVQKLRNVSSVSTLSKLQKLTLNAKNLSTSFLADADFPTLRRLELDTWREHNFSVIAKFRGLKEISLGICGPDLSVLLFCPKLETVLLPDCTATELAPLTQLTKLKELSLTSRTCSDFACLAEISSLKLIALNDTFIADISIFKNLPNLRYLSFDDTPVTEISSLPEFPVLEDVSMTGCNIQSYGPLSLCKHLQSVDADDYDFQY